MRLSKREIQVAELIAWGASDKEVAIELSISVHTVHVHRRNGIRKVGGRNAQDLSRYYWQYKNKMFFGFSPRQIRHIAGLLLLLILIVEISNLPALRSSRIRPPKAEEKNIPARRPLPAVRRAPQRIRKPQYA